MEETHQPYLKKPKVKVCVNKTCCMRGSEKIYETLDREIAKEADVSKTPDCFRFCEIGPNVAVNGNVLHRINEGDVVRRVRKEIEHPSRKLDGVGEKSLDELDSVLDSLFP